MAKEVKPADEHTAEEEDNRGSAVSPTSNLTVKVPNASTGVDAAIRWLRKGRKSPRSWTYTAGTMNEPARCI